MTEPSPKGPSLGQRDAKIDALRGFNLLGIAIVNTPWIGLNPALPELLGMTRAGRPSPHELISRARRGPLRGKFYTQFRTLCLGTAK